MGGSVMAGFSGEQGVEPGFHGVVVEVRHVEVVPGVCGELEVHAVGGRWLA